MKKKLIIFLFLTFFLLPFNVNAMEAFTIDKYDIKVKVNEDNTLDIVEDLTVNFTEKRHGIMRNIPLVNNVRRVDGTSNKIRARVRNIKVNTKFSTSIENNDKVIKIGDANKYVIGKQNYVISYTYDLKKEKNKDFDELYFNLIGTDWNTTIDNITFTISMPKEFDTSKSPYSLVFLISTSLLNS